MKKIFNIVTLCFICIILLGCTKDTKKEEITKEIAYDGVNNYCHEKYDWSIAIDNPEIMYVKMGEETNKEYEVIFRSYTGSFVYFYVDKENGKTKIMEENPIENTKKEIDTIQISDYLNKE